MLRSRFAVARARQRPYLLSVQPEVGQPVSMDRDVVQPNERETACTLCRHKISRPEANLSAYHGPQHQRPSQGGTVYIFMYIYTHTHLYACMYFYVRFYVCISVPIFIYICIYIFMCVCLCICFTCVHLCVYIMEYFIPHLQSLSLFIYLSTFIYIHTNVCVRPHTCTCMCTHNHPQAHDTAQPSKSNAAAPQRSSVFRRAAERGRATGASEMRQVWRCR